MTEGLYLRDAYLRNFSATVVRSSPGEIGLSATAFYPTGGGQPCDTGTLSGPDGRVVRVVDVTKSPTGILHRIEGDPFPVGTPVEGRVDWDRRYTHMRYHTGLHILSGVVYHRFRAAITGGQIYEDRARMDLSLPELNAALAEEVVADMRRVVAEDRPIHVRFLSRDEAQRDPSLVRVAAQLMPDVSEVRLIDIEGFDVQADGGTHVRSTGEVGDIRLQRIENKGARNKRLYLELGPPPRREL
jgi:misacylated tRNA(Ala) deacylase